MKSLFLLVYDHTYGRWIVISLPITQPWQHLQQGKAAVFLVGWVLPNFSWLVGQHFSKVWDSGIKSSTRQATGGGTTGLARADWGKLGTCISVSHEAKGESSLHSKFGWMWGQISQHRRKLFKLAHTWSTYIYMLITPTIMYNIHIYIDYICIIFIQSGAP